MKLNEIQKLDVFDYLKGLKKETIDLAIVDPPYNMKIDKWDEFRDENEYFEFTYKWLDLVIEKLKKQSSLYLFNNNYNSAVILNYLKQKDIDFKNWIVWYKKDGFSHSKRKYINNQETILFYTKGNDYTFNYEEVRVPYSSTSRIKAAAGTGIVKNGKRWFPNPNGKLCTDVWEIPSERHSKKVNGKVIKSIHRTPKPEKLIERIIKASSNKGDLILDLFSGTGTTAFVAKKLQRNFTGCEINSEYIDFIARRLSHFD